MTAVIFPDAQLAVRNRLRELLAGRSESHAEGATVSTRPPKDSTLPYIRIRTDGGPRDARYTGRETIRVLVWHRDEGLGQALAALCEALLTSAGSSADIRNIAGLASPVPIGDDNGDPLSFFTVTAYLRPSQLS